MVISFILNINNISLIFSKCVLNSDNQNACHILIGFSNQNFEMMYKLVETDSKITYRMKSRHISPNESLLLFFIFVMNYLTLDVILIQFVVNHNTLNNTLRTVMKNCHSVFTNKFI
jgi:hypothetical protein